MLFSSPEALAQNKDSGQTSELRSTPMEAQPGGEIKFSPKTFWTNTFMAEHV
jgi:hypothetical protein